MYRCQENKPRLIKVSKCYHNNGCSDNKFSELYDAVESLKGEVLTNNVVINIKPMIQLFP